MIDLDQRVLAGGLVWKVGDSSETLIVSVLRAAWVGPPRLGVTQDKCKHLKGVIWKTCPMWPLIQKKWEAMAKGNSPLHPGVRQTTKAHWSSETWTTPWFYQQGEGGGSWLLATMIKELDSDQIKILLSISRNKTIGLLLQLCWGKRPRAL